MTIQKVGLGLAMAAMLASMLAVIVGALISDMPLEELLMVVVSAMTLSGAILITYTMFRDTK